MKPLVVFTYVACCLFLLGGLGKTQFLDKLPTKKKVIVFLGCFILPAIYLSPYYFEIVPAKMYLPGWANWLPFFILAGAAAIVYLFFPQKKKQAGMLLAKITIGMMLLFNLLPFVVGIIQRW